MTYLEFHTCSIGQTGAPRDKNSPLKVQLIINKNIMLKYNALTVFVLNCSHFIL